MKTLIIQKPLGTRLFDAEVAEFRGAVDGAYEDEGAGWTTLLALPYVTSVAIGDDTVIVCLKEP